MRKRSPFAVQVRLVEKLYRQLYFEKYRNGSALKLNGVQRGRVKEILEVMEPEELARRMRRYFGDKSAWLQERCHPWNVFAANVDQYGGRHGAEDDRGKYADRGDWIKEDIRRYQSGKAG